MAHLRRDRHRNNNPPVEHERSVCNVDFDRGLVQRGQDRSTKAIGPRSRRAQGADDGLRVTLDYGQVGTDGDLRAPAALLPVLQ